MADALGFSRAIALSAKAMEGAGVAAIVLGIGFTTVRVTSHALRTHDWSGVYEKVRQGIGRAILLGLELLVGADIIRTVAESPTLQTVSVLGVIVLIRTFLSLTLERELKNAQGGQARV